MLHHARDAAKDVQHVRLVHVYMEKQRFGMHKRVLCEYVLDTHDCRVLYKTAF